MDQRYPQAVLVSCVVPWDENECFMEESFRAQVASLITSGVTHLYVFGTAGEGHAVDTERFRHVVKAFRAETHHEGIHPQVGVIALSTANVIERIAMAYDMGFRMFQVSLPCWGVLNDTELLTFFKDVCGAFPDSQFLHYNLPRAGRVLTAADYRRIADEVPNLVATKLTGSNVNLARDVMRLVPEVQHFFTEPLFAVGSGFGPCSLLSSFGPLSMTMARRYFEAGRNGQREEVFELARQYAELSERLFAPMGGQVLTDGAYDKIIARVVDHDIPMRLLSPYEAFTEDVCAECEKIFRRHYSDWVEDHE